MITYLSRVITFSAAHRYYRPEWSDDQNRETFGACANPHGHGHNYTLEIMVSGVPDPETGFCVDLPALDRVLERQVKQPLDHQHVNHAIPDFAYGKKVPTTENLVVWIWEQLLGEVPGARLVRLRLREDEQLFVDCFGPSEPDGSRRGPVVAPEAGGQPS